MNVVCLTFFLLCTYSSVTSKRNVSRLPDRPQTYYTINRKNIYSPGATVEETANRDKSIPIATVSGQNCQQLTQLSGEIHDSVGGHYSVLKCWFIQVPPDSYMRLELNQLKFTMDSCSKAYLKVTGGNETYAFCHRDTTPQHVTASNNVTITFCYTGAFFNSGSFQLNFTTESLICKQDNHFRCSSDFCIHEYQVCNGVKDCADGADEVGCERGIVAVRGMNVSRINAINWLKNQRTSSFGWGKNTHRAITALYLSKAMTFHGGDMEEELIAKQLELQISLALLRNASDPLSISELSMFVNALAVTCHNPRKFYGYNLLQILSDRVISVKSPLPSVYLTLCNLNWTLSNLDVENLVDLLNKPSNYPFNLDVRALTIMALTCVRNKTQHFRNIAYAESLYNSTIQNLIRQNPDGSFGNVYTTALVTQNSAIKCGKDYDSEIVLTPKRNSSQALIATGHKQSEKWNSTATAWYLMKQLNASSVDFLSIYLTLPIFSGRSLVDIKTVDCSDKTRKERKDREISEVTNELGGKMEIQYSLYIGDHKDAVHTLYLRMPENSSAYDAMQVAQVADSKYKFLHKEMSGQMYVYKIAGIINDPEAGKFWLLYTGDHYMNGTVEHHTKSPDKCILKDNDHLIMWYRTIHI